MQISAVYLILAHKPAIFFHEI